MKFHEVLRELRMQKKLSQKELAGIIGVSQAAVYYWEKGERLPKMEQIYKIAAALDVTTEDLLGGEFEERIYSSLKAIDEIPQKIIDTAKRMNEMPEQLIANTRKNALLNYYESLNNTGQKEAVKRVKELTFNPEYKAKVQGNTTARAAKTEVLNAAHERTDIEVTDEMRKHDDAIMDDENF